MDDEDVQARIEELEREEQKLRQDEAAAADTDDNRVSADAQRLAKIRVELDLLWDYLRQRRALRAAGQDPEGARMRDEGTVEGYLG